MVACKCVLAVAVCRSRSQMKRRLLVLQGEVARIVEAQRGTDAHAPAQEAPKADDPQQLRTQDRSQEVCRLGVLLCVCPCVCVCD